MTGTTAWEIAQSQPCELGAPEAFSDEYAPASALEILQESRRRTRPIGRNSEVTAGRFLSSCCGWEKRPDGREFYDALRADTLTGRQKAMICVWSAEATSWELLAAWAERVYTWRMLVTAMHKVGRLGTYKRFREINAMALVPEHDGVRLWRE